jgi:hypothetical protein
MVSTDHFRHELLAQIDRAARLGRTDILITSWELCRSVPRGTIGPASDAMQAGIKAGDILLVERTNGAGMAARYLLPRAN